MTPFRLAMLCVAMVLAAPVTAVACIYPTGLRTANITLAEVLGVGGTVSVHHRERLRRSMVQVNAQAIAATLTPEVGRRTARAMTAVIDTATALAEGRGLTVVEDLRPHISHLNEAIDDACSGETQVAASADEAGGAEQGKSRQTGQGGGGLTFRQGVGRLSLTFTVYLTFLAFLLGVRRQIRKHLKTAEDANDLPNPLEVKPR
ncbi:MAG: hypothetical protein AB3N09_09060 [Tateyamaria sp.]